MSELLKVFPHLNPGEVFALNKPYFRHYLKDSLAVMYLDCLVHRIRIPAQIGRGEKGRLGQRVF